MIMRYAYLAALGCLLLAACAAPKTRPIPGQMVFRADRTGNLDVYRIASDGTTTNLTHHSAGDNMPVLSPDGTRIAFISDRIGRNWILHVMQADGSNVTRIANHSGSDGNPSWSPDGNQLVFESFARLWPCHAA
jgi:TolB protein